MISKRMLFHLALGILLAVATMTVLAAFRLPSRVAVEASGKGALRAMAFRAMQEAQERNAIPKAETEPEPTKESRLQFGKAARASSNDISIALHFTAAAGETVGVIRARVKVPDGPWQFRKLELPEGSRLKASSKERRAKSGGVETRVIEIDVSYGSRAIRNGTLGFLVFSLPATGGATDALLEELAVEKLETGPPVPELVSPGSAPRPMPLPSEPPVNPAQTCFFFSH